MFTVLTSSVQAHSRRGLHILKTIAEVRKYRRDAVVSNKRIGFVPTMGALHEGHITLMTHSKQENDLTMGSIFVNPSQFSAGEDLDKYPRTLEADLEKLQNADVDAVFVPDGREMYANYPQTNQLCHVEPAAFSKIYEGRARPEFFRGVATVVTKLFNIVAPDVSYFGQKDISQCILIQNLVKDLNMPVEIRVLETIRAASDGLALSSRNAYLTPKEREVAGVLFTALSRGRTLIEQRACRRSEVEQAIQTVLQSEPLVTRVEYISIASHINMQELGLEETEVSTGSLSANDGAVISSAIRLGNVRLIDNVLVGKAGEILHHVVKK